MSRLGLDGDVLVYVKQYSPPAKQVFLDLLLGGFALADDSNSTGYSYTEGPSGCSFKLGDEGIVQIGQDCIGEQGILSSSQASGPCAEWVSRVTVIGFGTPGYIWVIRRGTQLLR